MPRSDLPKESQIQRTILDGLLRLGIFAWRNNVLPVPIRRGRQIVGVRTVDPHIAGMPDIFCLIPCPCCRRGMLIGIEVKVPGGKQRPTQIEWEQKMKEKGGLYILAYSFDDVERKFKDLNLFP